MDDLEKALENLELEHKKTVLELELPKLGAVKHIVDELYSLKRLLLHIQYHNEASKKDASKTTLGEVSESTKCEVLLNRNHSEIISLNERLDKHFFSIESKEEEAENNHEVESKKASPFDNELSKEGLEVLFSDFSSKIVTDVDEKLSVFSKKIGEKYEDSLKEFYSGEGITFEVNDAKVMIDYEKLAEAIAGNTLSAPQNKNKNSLSFDREEKKEKQNRGFSFLGINISFGGRHG